SPTFRYTKNSKYLTNEHRQFYEENGYIIFRSLVSHESLDEYRQHFIDICNGKTDSGNLVVMKDLSLMKTDVKGEFLINKVRFMRCESNSDCAIEFIDPRL
ncbi:hypothetical protein Trydic_g22011, partial [Trypoxylus dichotomus]